MIGVSAEIRIGYLPNVLKAWSLTSPAPTHPETAKKKRTGIFVTMQLGGGDGMICTRIKEQ
jgi:hypothetical protein